MPAVWRSYSATPGPGLTTMSVAIRRQGQAAAQLILDRIANPDQPPQATLFATDLVQRQST